MCWTAIQISSFVQTKRNIAILSELEHTFLYGIKQVEIDSLGLDSLSYGKGVIILRRKRKRKRSDSVLWHTCTRPKTDLCKLWIISHFVLFSFLCVRLPSFPTSFCPAPRWCTHHVFCTLFSCLSIDSSLYHVILSHVTVFSVFFRKSKIELCDPQCAFWV